MKGVLSATRAANVGLVQHMGPTVSRLRGGAGLTCCVMRSFYEGAGEGQHRQKCEDDEVHDRGGDDGGVQLRGHM